MVTCIYGAGLRSDWEGGSGGRVTEGDRRLATIYVWALSIFSSLALI